MSPANENTSATFSPTRQMHGFNRADIFDRDNYMCALCSADTRDHSWPSALSPTLDHIIDKSSGGEDTMENLQTTCLACSQKKVGKSVPDVSGLESIIGEHMKHHDMGARRLDP